MSTYDEPLKSPQSGRSETRVVPNGLSTRSDKRECAFGTNTGGTARKRPVFKDVCAFLFIKNKTVFSAALPTEKTPLGEQGEPARRGEPTKS